MPEDWTWRENFGLEYPFDWQEEDGDWYYRTMFDELPLEAVESWPAYVSFAEANAYCHWEGIRLPTEAELHQATYGTPTGNERPYP